MGGGGAIDVLFARDALVTFPLSASHESLVEAPRARARARVRSFRGGTVITGGLRERNHHGRSGLRHDNVTKRNGRYTRDYRPNKRAR